MGWAVSGMGVVARAGENVNAPGISTSIVWVSARGERPGRAGYMLETWSSFGGQRLVEADGVLTTRSKFVTNGLRFGVEGYSGLGTYDAETRRMVVVGPGAAAVPMLRRALNGAGIPGRRA
jgi:hypothetical protein